MIGYLLLRAIAGIALRWYYRNIEVEGLDRLPRGRPLLLVVNHPNALVDALLVGWVVPRRIRITAKSTIFANPIANRLLRWLGVLPLYRTSDVAKVGEHADPLRNRESFKAVQAALRSGGTVLVFPEGKTHDEPGLAPLKSGAARMALIAADSGEVPQLAIVPIGLTFERKDQPRTRVLVQVGEPIIMSSWRPAGGGSIVDALTAEIDVRLRAVTLNYTSADDAARTIRLASVLSALTKELPRMPRSASGLGAEARLARRIDQLSAQLQDDAVDPTLRIQGADLERRLDAIERDAAHHGILIEDVGVNLGLVAAIRFTVREGWLLLIAGPIALWGRINHWLPFTAARMIAMQSIESAADPAMRTLVAGAALVLLTYLLQTLAVGLIFGPAIGVLYLVSLPIAADVNFTLSDRLKRAVLRASAYLNLRRNRDLQRRLAAEISDLRIAVADFEAAVARATQPGGAVGTDRQDPSATHPDGSPYADPSTA